MFIRTRLVNIITFGFASGITLFPFVLIKPGIPLSRRIIRHEQIHLRQQAELLVLPFYLLYIGEYCIRLIQHKNHYSAYRHISFEREAYQNEGEKLYLEKRTFWSWIKYL